MLTGTSYLQKKGNNAFFLSTNRKVKLRQENLIFVINFLTPNIEIFSNIIRTNSTL